MEVVFQIGLHTKDLELLNFIQAFFGGIGFISSSPKYMSTFKVTSPLACVRILTERQGLHKKRSFLCWVRGAKAKDFLDWVKAAELINEGEHLNTEGSFKILQIKAGMNTGRKFE